MKAKWFLFAPVCIALAITVACEKEKSALPDPLFKANSGNLSAELYIPENEPASIGSYQLIVFEDGKEKQRLNANRDGTVVQLWVVDLLEDGKTDILVWTQSVGSGSYGIIDLYQPMNGKYKAVPLKDLSESQLLGYNGHDTFSVENGMLKRQFPHYLEDDVNAAPSGGSRQLTYDFARDRWVEAE